MADLYSLRKQFQELTSLIIPAGGATLGTQEGRFVWLAMRDKLGFKREAEDKDHGWNIRYGKDGTWGEWIPMRFEDYNSHWATYEYIAAINAMQACGMSELDQLRAYKERVATILVAAQRVLDAVEFDEKRQAMYISMPNVEYGFALDEEVVNPLAAAIAALKSEIDTLSAP